MIRFLPSLLDQPYLGDRLPGNRVLHFLKLIIHGPHEVDGLFPRESPFTVSWYDTFGDNSNRIRATQYVGQQTAVLDRYRQTGLADDKIEADSFTTPMIPGDMEMVSVFILLDI